MNGLWGLIAFGIISICSAAQNFEHALGHITPQISENDQQEAVFNLIRRILPLHADRFIVSVDASIGPKDTFQIESLDSKIKITGNSGVSVAAGFHHYLKQYLNCHISWNANQLKIPEYLPQVKIKITSHDRFRYYQNVCTTSYSFVWWDWTQWEKHIDWMALNSFNLVLAFNGQEAIWERVFAKLKMTAGEINEHFSGPAFLSWNRMGNIRGWGGPLSQSWHSRSLILQKRIVKRMRKLGITTVLPAFAGHVPRAFKRLFPDAKLYPLDRWNRFNDTFCCPYLLDPTEPLFKKVGNMFLSEVVQEFGTDHLYNCDTFNEMVPFTSNTTYLNLIGKSIYSAMTDVDSSAIWLLQGWMFYSEMYFWTPEIVKSLILSVPLGKMIVLDLQSEQFPQYERLDSYYGQPYIWCMLHNFGGTLGMVGSADIINKRVFEARTMNGSTLIGTGLTPEGINPNYVIYDLMGEMAWRREPANLTNWFSAYALRRYGSDSEKASLAWEILRRTVYNYKGFSLIRGKFAYNRSPRTKIQTWTWYNQCELLEAWDYLLEASSDLSESEAYRHDLTDLTRQVLQNFGDEYYNKFISAFNNKRITDFQKATTKFLDVFDDVEKILASNEYFLLGRWINSAKRAADNQEDEELYEYNARNQITLWGPTGEIKDYANKQWSGIVSDFFKLRWIVFIQFMNESLVNQEPFKESKVIQTVFRKVEEPFTFDRTSYPETPTGNTVEIAQKLHTKWRGRGHCRVQRSRKFLNFVEPEYDEDAEVILIK